MEKQWNKQSLYGKSLIAVALYRNKKEQTANKIIKSLKEQSSLSPEIGMYWDKNVSDILGVSRILQRRLLLWRLSTK